MAASLSPAGAAQRVALVIGNSDYTLVPALANPKNDAALMAETLRRVGFEVIEAKNADRRGMARAIKDFGKRLRGAGPDAVGLFYYAGHGVQAAGTNYLIPLGAPVEDETDLEIEAVSASWVLAQMESAGNALNIVILDACRNNPFRGSFRSATRGLVRMNAPSGSLVAYAAAPGQVAADGITDNSPYTAALVAAMREPGLSLEQVFKRVRVAVEAATGTQQTPWEESSLKGDFYFVPQGSTVTITPPGAPQPQPGFDVRAVELALWETVKDSDKVVAYKAYLAQYPNGTFAVPARLKIEELEDKETATLELPSQPLPEPAFAVTEMDETYFALKAANVRAQPSAQSEKVGRLAIDAAVSVTGKVEGKQWYRVAHAAGTAYVFAPLLKAVAANQEETRKSEARKLELAFWNSIKDSTNEAEFDAYLINYPAGAFASLAKAKLARLALSPSSSKDEVALQEPNFDPSELDINGRWDGEITWENMINGKIYETCSVEINVKSLKFDQWHTCRRTWNFSGTIRSDGSLSKGTLWRSTVSYSLSGHIWSAEGPARKNSDIRAFVKLEKKN